MVLIPVYEDPDDAVSSPFALSNVEPFTWQWFSTINRVNSQVQKVCPGRFFSGSWVMGLIYVQDACPFACDHTGVFTTFNRRFIFAGLL
jgi:hypothetical protein